MLLLPAPLHPYRPADGPGKQRRLRGRVVGPVGTVGARAVHVDDANPVALDPEHPGARALEAVHVLGRGPHRDAIGPHVGHAAGRPDGAVGLHGPAIGGGERARPGRRRAQGREIALPGDLLVADDPARPHRLELLGVIRQTGARAPLGLERARRPQRVPLAFGDHREEALDPHHAGSPDGGDRRFVHRDERGAERGRADHPGVEHAGQHQVLQVAVVPGDLRGQIRPGQRLADEAEAVVGLERRRLVHLQVQRAIADQIAVAHRPGAVLAAHHAVGDLEVTGGPAQALRGQVDEPPARGRGGQAELGAAAGDAVAAAGPALVGRERGVALDHRDALERDVELLARELAHRDAPAGAEIHPAHEDGDRAVAVHGQERVHRVGGERLAEEAIGVGDGLRAGRGRARRARVRRSTPRPRRGSSAGRQRAAITAPPASRRPRGAPRG